MMREEGYSVFSLGFIEEEFDSKLKKSVFHKFHPRQQHQPSIL